MLVLATPVPSKRTAPESNGRVYAGVVLIDSGQPVLPN
jgi:hypothetical protein